MMHFDTSKWTGFVRGIAAEQDHAAMEAHILSGCRRCWRTVGALGIAMTAHAEGGCPSPEFADAARIARAIYPLEELERVYIPRIVARLVYDSFRDRLSAGMRSRPSITRHALYQAEDYSLDLLIEHRWGTAYVALVGQIANQTDPETFLANLPVFLMSGKQVVAYAFSNAFGEFQFEYRLAGSLRLQVQAGRDLQKRIEVSLRRLEDGLREKDEVL